jgi:ubiquinone/menaquinone biosynthesis C-methylase UbiE
VNTNVQEPEDKKGFRDEFDRAYTRFARLYDLALKITPVWGSWIGHALPYLRGPRILEVSFGTGYLMGRYGQQFTPYGVDYNARLIQVARSNLEKQGVTAFLQRADVDHLPYKSGSFDTVVNTMAFTGYPDGMRAMQEFHRVLRRGGRLVLIDIAYPSNGNWLGVRLTQMWASLGDIIRDIGKILNRFDLDYSEREIGGFGSVHLYIAEKGSDLVTDEKSSINSDL